MAEEILESSWVMVFHFRLGWGRIDGAHVSFIYLNVNVYMFWFLNICQCVSECPVKCEDSRSRHSHLAAFTDSSHSPNVGFPFTRRPPCCKIQQITFTTLMDPHINMQICKRPTFSQRISFLHFCFYFHPLSSLDNVCKGCGTFTVVHFWLLVFLSHRVAFHVLPLQVPPPPLPGKHNDE